MISYSGLLQKLNEKGLTKTALAKELGISSRTVAKIGRREKIADYVLEKMAAFLVVLQMNCAGPFRITVCFKCSEMRKTSVCPEACTMNFKYG